MALIDTLRAAWPVALAAWSPYLRLRDPLLCVEPEEAKAAGATQSFALIRMSDQTVVLDLTEISRLGLERFPVEILAHEIGHHVLAPANLSDHARCIARMRTNLPGEERHAPMVANLYTDLLINDRLQRWAGLDMAGIYRTLRDDAAAGKLWRLYLRIYERLFELPRDTLTGKVYPAMEADAELGARLVRHYAGNWLKGAGGFAALLLPYLTEDRVSRLDLKGFADTQAAEGGAVDGLSEVDPDEQAVHPALDPVLNDVAGDTVASPLDPAQPTSLPAAGGQARSPYDYAEILKAAGVVAPAEAIAERYYRERARPHLIPYPRLPGRAGEECFPEGVDLWEAGMPFTDIDWPASLGLSPWPIPGVTTVYRLEGPVPEHERGATPLDLDLYVDCSGSMPDPRRVLSYPALAGAVICLSALRAGARIQATLWSGKNEVLRTDGFTRAASRIFAVLTGYLGGGTQFPLPLLRDSARARRPEDPPVHVLVVSDDGASTMFDTPDEQGTPGIEVVREALARYRGGCTLALELHAGLEVARPGSPYGWIKRAHDELGIAIDRVTGLAELIAFAQRFSRRHYGPAGAKTRRPA